MKVLLIALAVAAVLVLAVGGWTVQGLRRIPLPV